MTQYKKSRRSHIRWDRLAIIMAGIIVIVAGVFVGIKMLATNPYEKYDAYNEKTKLYGELQHDSQKEEDVYYLSVHYPEYQEKAMNDLVANYRKKHVKADKKHSGMQYIIGILIVLTAARRGSVPAHLVFIVYSVDYQGI